MTNPEIKTVIYQIEVDDFERLITRAVSDAMERYTSTSTPTPAAERNDFLTRNETAARLHVTVATLRNWERNGYLIPVRAGRRVLYNAEQVRQFANANIKSK